MIIYGSIEFCIADTASLMIKGKTVMDISKERVLEYHLGGKIGLQLTRELKTLDDLCLAYTPGVAIPVREIHRNPEAAFAYTAKSNLIAVATDGTAILGLGDLGALASIPVMEGKAMLFKAFGDVDGWPAPLERCRKGGRNDGPTDPQRVIDAVCAIAPMYGGINLEDIAAPACFEIEDRLCDLLDIPVFHDDQWGTAVITLAAVKNYCLISSRNMTDLRIAVNGAGAAGIRITEMLKAAGCRDIILCDSKGAITEDRTDLTPKKREHAAKTRAKTIGEAMKGAHVFIGVSAADCIRPEYVKAMADFPAVLAMANPDPEIKPELVASALGAKEYVMATGRSDYPNQVNNALGFPFLFRGALDVRARAITLEMKIAAADALANVARMPVPEFLTTHYYKGQTFEFGKNYVIPKPFDRRLFVEVSYAVAEAALKQGAARNSVNLQSYRMDLEKRNTARFSRNHP